MGEKAFIKKLKGSDSAKSLVEVQNDVLVNVVSGLPNSNNPAINIIDNKDSAIIVAKNAQNWVVSGENLLLSSSSAYISEFTKSGAGLWIDSDYTFPASTSPTNPVVAIINPNAKWILRLCGKDLMSANETIDFTLVVKIGSTNISNINLSVARQAGVFCKELAIDFSDSLATMIKAEEGDVLTLQLICGDSTANATIFNGKTALTLLQRKVDGKSVASDTMTFDDVEQELDDINETLAEHIADTDNPHSVTKTQVGLGNVDNTSDADKPISDATQDALDLKADLSGATFTGDISATNLSGTNTGDQDLSGYAELSGATFTGDISATNLSGTNTGDQDLSGYALDNSVVHLSGNETIADVKTFSSFPVTPSSAPTTDYEVANKKYVDDNAGGGGGSAILPTGTCSTAGTTAAKEVTVAGYTETAGACALITFENKNTALGPALYIPFTGGTADDPMGVYTLTTIGNPTYTGDKFNSNGNSGLSYNITSLGEGTWCIQGKFMSTNTTTYQQLMGSGILFGFWVSKSTDNKLVLHLSGNGTTWSIVNGLTGAKNDWATDTEYYIRLRFTGTNYYVDWSTDGTNWTNDISITSSLIVRSIGGLRFGIYYNNSNPLIGTMDDLYVSIGSDTITDYPTLNINGSGAKPILHADGTRITPANPAYFVANCPIQFWYDGTGYRFKQEVVKNYVNGTTWYNLSNNGWVEQGGYATAGPYNAGTTITLPVTMANTGYTVLVAPKSYNHYTDDAMYTIVSTSQIKLHSGYNGGNSASQEVCWEVKGMAA